jgi:two-component system cell cycle response regulator
MNSKKILYVEDNLENKMLVRRILEAKGYEVLEASDGIEGIKMAQGNKPDLVLMDLNLPTMDGQTAATRIKATHGLENIVIIALTACVMEGEREKSLIAGCDGFIPKPIDVDALPEQLEEYLNGRKERMPLKQEKDYMLKYAQHLAERLEKNIGFSYTDPLTGLSNRREFQLKLSQEISRAQRFKQNLSCIILDIDNFKRINDQFGHPVGDIILKKIAQLLIKELRKYELVARYGGEEFVILLAQEDGTGALAVSERLRESIAKRQFKISSNHIKITVSLGISCFSPQEALSEEKLIKRADDALYQAKKSGKNKSVLFCN